MTTHEMLATMRRLSDQRAAGRHVLAIMDTTDLRFPTHEASKRGFGRDDNDLCPGLFLHPVLAVDAGSGGIIGLVDCVVLNRTQGLQPAPRVVPRRTDCVRREGVACGDGHGSQEAAGRRQGVPPLAA